MTGQARLFAATIALVAALGAPAGVQARSTPDGWVAESWWGAHGAPRLSLTVTCRSTGDQAVWPALVGHRSLDIIQVGTVHGDFFYAYGSGVRGSGTYVEKFLGPADGGWHRYGLSLAGGSWTLTIDGATVAVVADTFRTWPLRQSQVMAEGDLPFGRATCRLPGSGWSFGGQGSVPPYRYGPTWWTVG